MIFANSTRPVGENFYRAMQGKAPSFNVETAAISIDGRADLQASIDAFVLQPNGGLVMAADPALAHRALAKPKRPPGSAGVAVAV